jgi:CubicO group peptidase (beta-lactamase class C family)
MKIHVRPFAGASRSTRDLVYVGATVTAFLGTTPSRLLAQSPPASDPRFDALATLAEGKMKEFGVPGMAIGILQNGTMTVRGLGVTNVEDPLPVTAHTVFPIASISKTFAATAIMRLVEQGKIDLRAPVRTYIPEFRVRDSVVSRDVTMWHLLTHLGGGKDRCPGRIAARRHSRTSSARSPI